MSELDQLLSQINNGQLSSERLTELQEMADAQLHRYEQALAAITRNGDSFTFEDFKEHLRLASGGNAGSLTLSEWDQMALFPAKRLALRDQAVATIREGQRQFTTIKSALDSKLGPGAPKASTCFIATAAYGSPLEADVGYLQSFRDDCLRHYKVGRQFISFYEHYSPPIAESIRKSSLRRRAVRIGFLRPLVTVLRLLWR